MRAARAIGIGAAIVLVVVVLVAVFASTVVRFAAAGYLTAFTGQKTTIASDHVHWGWTTILTLHDIRIQNPSWAQGPDLARIGSAEIGFAWGELLTQHHASRLVLRDFDIDLERQSENQINWHAQSKSDTKPGNSRNDLPIQTVFLDNGHIRYADRVVGLELHIQAHAIPESDHDAGAQAGKAAASTGSATGEANPAGTVAGAARLTTRIDFSGSYQQGTFSGRLMLGDTIGGGTMFPAELTLDAGATKIHAQGKTDATLTQIDARVAIAGPTMANLYPFLLLPLPASPPYQVEGQLTRNQFDFGYHHFAGKIGETELGGDAQYRQNAGGKPLLTVDIHAKVLNFGDLGPLIGIHGAPGANDQQAQAQASTTAAGNAQQLEQGGAGTAKKVENADAADRKILPSAEFSPDRLRAIDADAKLVADQIKMPTPFAFERMNVALKLHGGVLALEPLEFGFAGGTLTTNVRLDGNREPIAATIRGSLRQAHLNRLLPANPLFAQSTGRLGATIDLTGSGDSVAAMLGTANGSAAFASSGGELPATLLDLAGLNAGAFAKDKLEHDPKTPLRCAAALFAVKQGDAVADTIVLDTGASRINGHGDINFATEGLSFEFDPQPKHLAFPAARAPLRVDGTLAHPQPGIDKKALALRGGAMIALGILNPLAALLPLVGPPSGSDADCSALLHEAEPAKAQEKAPSAAPAAPPVTKGASH